jgi:hypothetical protein
MHHNRNYSTCITCMWGTAWHCYGWDTWGVGWISESKIRVDPRLWYAMMNVETLKRKNFDVKILIYHAASIFSWTAVGATRLGRHVFLKFRFNMSSMQTRSIIHAQSMWKVQVLIWTCLILTTSRSTCATAVALWLRPLTCWNWDLDDHGVPLISYRIAVDQDKLDEKMLVGTWLQVRCNSP